MVLYMLVNDRGRPTKALYIPYQESEENPKDILATKKSPTRTSSLNANRKRSAYSLAGEDGDGLAMFYVRALKNLQTQQCSGPQRERDPEDDLK